MSNKDFIERLVQSWSYNNNSLFVQTVESIIATEQDKKCNSYYIAHLKKYINQKNINPTLKDHKVDGLIYEKVPSRDINSLYLSSNVVDECNNLFEELENFEILEQNGLLPINKILLKGEPGNGKTSLAEVIAYTLKLPMYVVSYEGIISSHLGETAPKLKRVFDFVSNQKCVLFFDEFDAVSIERFANSDNGGEMQRVLCSMLTMIDNLPNSVIFIAASNHNKMMDRSIIRRFQTTLTLDKPKECDMKRYVNDFFKKLNDYCSHSESLLKLFNLFNDKNYSFLEEVCNKIHRKYVLSKHKNNTIILDDIINLIIKTIDN